MVIFIVGIFGIGFLLEQSTAFGSSYAASRRQETETKSSEGDAQRPVDENTVKEATDRQTGTPRDTDSEENQPDSEEKRETSEEKKLIDAKKQSVAAPQQPFFNHWLWLAGLALALFVLAYIPPKQTANEPGESHLYSAKDKIQAFAFRFTALHFVLFFMPLPFAYLPYVGPKLYTTYAAAESAVITWVAENVLSVSSDFVPYSGSGDSTESYVRLFTVFSVALIISIVWTLIDRRKTGHPILRDLFHSNITYVLALTMLGYGLMKMGYARNQFAMISGSMLETTWGDSSPMGVLWRFMGASRPYTIFAGLGETIGALLLIFRRTRTLGALAVFGVMTNVVMLNFCYDVPVKINSTHLALLALCLIMKDSARLGNVLLFNRPTGTVDPKPAYTGRKTIWIQRAVKTIVVAMWFGLPIYYHISAEIEFANLPTEPEFFDTYKVEQFRINDELQTEENGADWKYVGFRLRNMNVQMESVPTYWLMVRTRDKRSKSHTFEIGDDGNLAIGPSRGGDIEVPKELSLKHLEGNQWQLTGITSDGSLEILLERIDGSKTTLLGRGFRWINEVPFNR